MLRSKQCLVSCPIDHNLLRGLRWCNPYHWSPWCSGSPLPYPNKESVNNACVNHRILPMTDKWVNIKHAWFNYGPCLLSVVLFEDSPTIFYVSVSPTRIYFFLFSKSLRHTFHLDRFPPVVEASSRFGVCVCVCCGSLLKNLLKVCTGRRKKKMENSKTLLSSRLSLWSVWITNWQLMVRMARLFMWLWTPAAGGSSSETRKSHHVLHTG